MPADPVYILDELELRPGKLAAFCEALEARYLPGAQMRGMQLLHTWVTPPVELEQGGTRVLLVWQLDGVPGFWGMRARNASADIAQWWHDCEQFVVSRTRRYAAEASALPRLEASARTNA
jgi:hypothetical protein